MNCFEFRFRLTAEPHDRAPEVLQHRRQCPACDSFAARQASLDAALAQAVRLPVPTELPARIVLRRMIEKMRARQRLAVAASVLALIGITSAAWWEWRRPPLEQSVLAHVLEERELLASRRHIPATEVAGLLRAVGVALRSDIGEVRYAGICRINRHDGGHLVVPGRRGQVTVLVLPREAVTERRALAGDGFEGVIVPAGRGSMAIVGEPGEELGPIERRLQEAILVPA